MRPILLAVAAVLAIAAITPEESAAQRSCSRGKPCGNTCINVNYTCRTATPARPAPRQAVPATAPTAATIPEDAAYVGSSRGTVYYPIGCSAWRSLSQPNLRFFATQEAAEAAGLVPTTNGSCAGDFASSPSLPPEAPPVIARACLVERVVDGDTIECSSGETVRLLLIDAPEMNQGDFGEMARLALMGLAPAGSELQLELDVEQRDRYGRTLAYAYGPQGNMLNEELAQRGYAVVSVYPPNVRYVDRLREAADAARAGRRGLWTASAFECLPADHRAGQCR